MSVIATVTVTEKKDSSGNYLGEHEYTVTYTSKKGQDDSGNKTDPDVSATNPTGTGTDTEFNNFVVAPVNVEFDFTKKLSGRNLKANEFTFNLLNEAGAVVGTAKMMRTVILNSRALNTKLVTLEQILQESEMTARPLITL